MSASYTAPTCSTSSWPYAAGAPSITRSRSSTRSTAPSAIRGSLPPSRNRQRSGSKRLPSRSRPKSATTRAHAPYRLSIAPPSRASSRRSSSWRLPSEHDAARGRRPRASAKRTKTIRRITETRPAWIRSSCPRSRRPRAARSAACTPSRSARRAASACARRAFEAALAALGGSRVAPGSMGGRIAERGRWVQETNDPPSASLRRAAATLLPWRPAMNPALYKLLEAYYRRRRTALLILSAVCLVVLFGAVGWSVASLVDDPPASRCPRRNRAAYARCSDAYDDDILRRMALITVVPGVLLVLAGVGLWPLRHIDSAPLVRIFASRREEVAWIY